MKGENRRKMDKRVMADIKNFYFTKWITQVKYLALTEFGFSQIAVDSMDHDSWRNYYNEGLSPRDALETDLSNNE